MKIFRKRRQSLLSNGKTAKYLQYAVGEIVLVVIGILIAVQINNWNAQRRVIDLSDQALLELQQEVKTTIALIKRKNEVNILATEIMKKYLEEHLADEEEED